MHRPLTPIHGSLMALFLFLHAGPAFATSPAGQQGHAASRVDPATVIDAPLRAALAMAPKSADFPDSDAVCLLDLSTVKIEPDGAVIETTRKAYKLFNQRGRSLAEVSLFHDGGHQSLTIVAARTVKANGAVVPVRSEDVRVSTPGHDYAMYNDAVSTGFSLPAIEDNCTIDYTYRKTSTPRLSGHYASTWLFAGQYPVMLSRLTINAPTSKTLRYKLYNDDVCKPIITTAPTGRIKTYVFERRDVKPIVPEPMMPYPLEVASHMEVSTFASWAEIGGWYLKLQQPQAKATPPISATVSKLIAGKSGAADKARVIYDWVVNNTRYVGVQLGIADYRPHSASEVYSKRYGDAKDKANLLITMLEIAGIHAVPALLSAGSPIDTSGRLPSVQAFNHCIAVARVDGQDVWLDSTALTCPYGDIPAADRGAYALLIAPGKNEFKRVPSYLPAENSIEDHETIDVQEDGSAQISDRIVLRGSFAQSFRANMRAITPAQREQAAKQLIQNFASGAILKDYTLPDGLDRGDRVDLKFSLTAPQYAQQADDLILVPYTAAVKPQNPFTQDARTYPFEQQQSLLVKAEVRITIPKAYEFSRIPAGVTLSSPFNEQRLVFTKATDGRSLTITAETLTHQGAAPVQAYKQMQDYYKALQKVAAEKIVLKKT